MTPQQPTSPAHAAPVVLAFDTSTEALVIALTSATGVRVFAGEGGARASAQLIPRALELLADAACRLADVDAIAFGCGPGAFTGLRTACAVAQGLAYGAAKPVLPIDSLLVVAEDARERAGDAGGGADLWVAMDARMDEVYAAHYRWAAGHWSVRQAPALYTLESLNAQWLAEPPACVAGSALDAFGARLLLGQTCRRVPREGSRAHALARLAVLAWHDGAALDAALALPLYLRDKVALTTVERDALRASKAAVAAATAASRGAVQ